MNIGILKLRVCFEFRASRFGFSSPMPPTRWFTLCVQRSSCGTWSVRYWRSILRDSPVVGKPGEYKPLILDHRGRLYLFRYWEYEKKLADAIKQRVATSIEGVDSVLLKRFCVISGGPGTGKTTVVTKIITLLLEQTGGGTLRIALLVLRGKRRRGSRRQLRVLRMSCTVQRRPVKRSPKRLPLFIGCLKPFLFHLTSAMTLLIHSPWMW